MTQCPPPPLTVGRRPWGGGSVPPVAPVGVYSCSPIAHPLPFSPASGHHPPFPHLLAGPCLISLPPILSHHPFLPCPTLAYPLPHYPLQVRGAHIWFVSETVRPTGQRGRDLVCYWMQTPAMVGEAATAVLAAFGWKFVDVFERVAAPFRSAAHARMAAAVKICLESGYAFLERTVCDSLPGFARSALHAATVVAQRPGSGGLSLKPRLTQDKLELLESLGRFWQVYGPLSKSSPTPKQREVWHSGVRCWTVQSSLHVCTRNRGCMGVDIKGHMMPLEPHAAVRGQRQ